MSGYSAKARPDACTRSCSFPLRVCQKETVACIKMKLNRISAPPITAPSAIPMLVGVGETPAARAARKRIIVPAISRPISVISNRAASR